jgi:CDP-diacylglycerol--glycerol-3-phosphate 3-phosphatidyltransferase
VNDQSFVSAATRDRIRRWAVPIATAFGRLGLTPNALTIVGFAGTCVAAWAAASEQWVLAGILVIAFGIFDLFDGALARATGRASKFGAFLDSTADRTGESLVLAGVAVGSAQAGFLLGTALAALTIVFASGVTYTRARAEALGLRGDVGIAPRPERLVVLAAGLALAGLLGGIDMPQDFGMQPGWDIGNGGAPALALALLVITVTSAVTVVQRLLSVKHQLETQENP